MEKVYTTSRMPSKDIKIEIISDYTRGNSKQWRPEAGIHGVTTTMIGLTNTLNRQGYDAELITGQDLKYLVPQRRRPHILWPVNPGKIIRKIKHDKPDIIASVVEGPAGILTLRAAKKLGIPSIALHTSNIADYVRESPRTPEWVKPRLAGLLDRLVGYGMKQADLVRVSSQEMIEKVQKYQHVPLEKIFVMSPGVDTHVFRRPEKEDVNPYTGFDWYKTDAKGIAPKVILYTGRVAPEKNYGDLLATLDSLDHNQHIVFIGPPTTNKDRQTLEETGQKYANFHWLGTKENGELAPYYRFADVFVTPSMSETYGHTPNESLVSGVPVVVAQNEVMAGRVDEGITGYTYPSGNRDALVEAIQKAMALKNAINPDVFDAHVKTHITTWDESAAIFLDAAQKAIDIHQQKKQETPPDHHHRRKNMLVAAGSILALGGIVVTAELLRRQQQSYSRRGR